MATASMLEKIASPLPGAPGLAGRAAALWRLARMRWAGLDQARRSWAMAAGGLIAALSLGLLWYALRTDWRTLYADLDPDDARTAGQALSQAQIPFEPSPDGAGILVPLSQLDKARLVTSAKGGLKTGRLGFELFDKPNWVGSEFDEQVNYQRALEGELEHTVGSLGDVASARVHLVLTHDSLFRDQERPAKASVVLALRHRTLADGEPEAIRNLVASAVDGLSPDRVVLVDAAGHLPLGPKTADALRLTAEQALEEKLVATLEPVTGQGNVRASVTLDYDPSAIDETAETYDPDQTVTLSMQRVERTSGAQPVAAGVPGAASNAPNTQALPVYPKETTPPESEKSEAGTYGSSKTVRHVMENSGRVRRMTAAIVVNDRLAQAPARGKPASWQPRSADELRHLTDLAQAAVGFDTARGDMVTVADLPFDENRSLQPATILDRSLATAENSPVLVKYLALLVGLLSVLAFGVRPALRRARPRPRDKALKGAKPQMALGTGAATGAQPPLQPAEEAETDPQRARAQEIFDEVTGHLRQEPTQSSRLLQSWIHSD